MDFNTFGRDEGFDYSVISEQVLGVLYKVRKNKEITTLDENCLIDGKSILTNIIDGNKLQSGEIDINSLSSTNSLFIYDYGSSALRAMEGLAKDSELTDYMNSFAKTLSDVKGSELKEIQKVESFFSVIGKLLDTEIEESKYYSAINSQNISAIGYM